MIMIYLYRRCWRMGKYKEIISESTFTSKENGVNG